jgi:hypothetical protein
MTKTFYDELMAQKQSFVRTNTPTVKNSFLNALENEMNNVTTTANGAKAYSTTMNKSLDLFGKIAACRNDLNQAQTLFRAAYKEDPETALRILFWARDIRGGQGERSVFRTVFKSLVSMDSQVASKLIPLVPFYGRWDDLLVLEDTAVWNQVLEMIKEQLMADLNTSVDENISLIAKWMPSINASSTDSKRLGRKIATYMGWKESFYRKALSMLRKKIAIVERAMCSKDWSEIDYAKLPSRAAFMYRKAFGKHDAARYQAYLNAVEKGEAKINAATLYPYDIVNEYLYKGARNDKTIDLQWNALPNYMEDKTFNGLVVADVSGSMYGMPMAVSISLAMYIAERNESPVWKDKFITFSASPTLENIVGRTVGERVGNLSRATWSMNTDLIAVFKTVLDSAVKHSVSAEDMPQKLIIVSDMQFDQCCRSNKRTNFEQIEKLYRKAGYEMPQLVFWNVNSHSNVPIQAHDTGTALVSGCSPSILKAVLTDKVLTPVDTMNDAVYTDRYDLVGKLFNS